MDFEDESLAKKTGKEKLSIIIPVYNEAKTADKLLKKVENARLPIKKEIIIIESNSIDGSREIIKRHEGKKDVRIFYEEKPQGKGHALKEGLKHATGTIILIQDADLEYDVRDYSKLLKPILEGKAKFVLGSRILGKKNWMIRKGIGNLYGFILNVGGWIYNALINLLYGSHMTDQATMFKVFRKDVFKNIPLRSNGFDLDIELVVKPLKRGIKPIEIPVNYKSRSTKEGKKIRFWRDSFVLLWAIVKYRFVD